MKTVIVVLIVCVFGLGGAFLLKENNALPIGVHHLINLKNPPSDLYHHLISDYFPFNTQGAEKTYKLSPKYKDIHEVGILFGENGMDSQQKFSGVLSMDFLCGESIKIEEEIKSFQRKWFMDSDMKRVKNVTFTTFDSSICGNLEEINLRISVKQPDSLLKEHGQLYVAVSAAP